MALTNNEGGAGDKKINLKVTSTPGPLEGDDRKALAPVFQILDDSFAPSGEVVNTVSGVVKSVYGSFTPAKGRMGDVYGFSAYISDGGETYKIDSTINNLSKGLVSALINNIDKDLTIKLYVNKNGYPSAYTTLTSDSETKVEELEYEVDGEKISVYGKSAKGTRVEYEDIHKAIVAQQPEPTPAGEEEEIKSEDIPF